MLYYKNLALESTNFSGQYEMSQNSWFYLIENRFCPQKFILWQEQNQNKANKHTPYRNALQKSHASNTSAYTADEIGFWDGKITKLSRFLCIIFFLPK